MTHQPPFAPPPGWEYPQSPSPAPARFTIHYGFALLAFFSLLGTVVPTILMFVGAGNASSDGTQAGQDASGFLGTFGVLWLLWGGMWTLVYVAFAVNHTLKERRRA
jgi:type II secretory pathway component PulF